jgi:hypothetical protein
MKTVCGLDAMFSLFKACKNAVSKLVHMDTIPSHWHSENGERQETNGRRKIDGKIDTKWQSRPINRSTNKFSYMEIQKHFDKPNHTVQTNRKYSKHIEAEFTTWKYKFRQTNSIQLKNTKVISIV